jgi:5-methylcytosine-specific restriction endonuclease McrA
MAAVIKELGLKPSGGLRPVIMKHINRLSIDISHWRGQGHLKNKTHNWSKKIPLEEILIENSLFTSTHHLKKRLLDERLIEYKCSICSISQYNNKPLSLQLHHINKISTDNRIDNLILLCPNCHTQKHTEDK